MAAALSLLGEINNALNPQPRTLRGQALVETVTGEGCSHPMEPLGQKDWMETFGWAWVPEEQWQRIMSPQDPAQPPGSTCKGPTLLGAVDT